MVPISIEKAKEEHLETTKRIEEDGKKVLKYLEDNRTLAFSLKELTDKFGIDIVEYCYMGLRSNFIRRYKTRDGEYFSIK